MYRRDASLLKMLLALVFSMQGKFYLILGDRIDLNFVVLGDF